MRQPLPLERRALHRDRVQVAALLLPHRDAVAFVREYKDPGDATKTYTTTWFDMWRIKDGKADEHWDGATIAAPPAGR